MGGALLTVTVELPHVGGAVIEGTIGKWLKQPGDTVRRYEPLVEVITDKVTLEVPSPVAGSLLRVLAEEGETIPMGAPLAEMETDEALPQMSLAPSPELIVLKGKAPAEETVGTTGYLVKGIAPVGPTGGGPAPEPGEVSAQPAAVGTEGVRLSPAVRRLIQEHGIDVAQAQ